METEKKPKQLITAYLQQFRAVTQHVRGEVAAAGVNLEHLPKEFREKLLGDGLWWAWVYDCIEDCIERRAR